MNKIKTFALGGKTKTILASAFMLLILPVTVFAASPEWGGGVTLSPNGGVGLSVGIGSRGSGAGNVWGGGGYAMGGWALSNPYGLPQGSLLGIASNLLFWLLAIFAIAGVSGFVLSGIMYLISTGDDDMIKRAKSGMTWSIVGIVIGLSGFIIMQAVAAMLSGASSEF